MSFSVDSTVLQGQGEAVSAGELLLARVATLNLSSSSAERSCVTCALISDTFAAVSLEVLVFLGLNVVAVALS